jgi:hypothetical protein
MSNKILNTLKNTDSIIRIESQFFFDVLTNLVDYVKLGFIFLSRHPDFNLCYKFLNLIIDLTFPFKKLTRKVVEKLANCKIIS